MLEVTWAAIYRRMARWEPPGSTSRATCQLCGASPWIAMAEFRELPEDVRHYIFAELQVVVSKRYLELWDEFEAASEAVGEPWETDAGARRERMRTLFEVAEDEMWNELAYRRADLAEMRRLFIEPRMQAYLDAAVRDLDPPA